jgi:hypothetical protein
MRCFVAPLLCGLLVTSAADAEMYRYVDENGITVYSERPPADGEATVIEPQAGPSETTSSKARAALQSQLEAAQDRRDDEAAAAKAREQAAAKAAERRAGCEKARRDLRFLQRSGQQLIPDKDGKLRLLSTDERVRREKEAREQIDALCD